MVPFRVNDGDFTIPLVIKDGYSFPFFDRGDPVSFEYRKTEHFDKGSIPRRPNVMDAIKTAFGAAYLVELGDLDDQGDGIFEQQSTWASIPATRTESGTICYTAQYTQASRDGQGGNFYPVNFDIAEVTFPITADILFEYFANTKPEPFIKSRLISIFSLVYSIGGPPPPQGRTVAEDSDVTLYKGRIYCRRTPLVQVPTTKPF